MRHTQQERYAPLLVTIKPSNHWPRQSLRGKLRHAAKLPLRRRISSPILLHGPWLHLSLVLRYILRLQQLQPHRRRQNLPFDKGAKCLAHPLQGFLNIRFITCGRREETLTCPRDPRGAQRDKLKERETSQSILEIVMKKKKREGLQ